jgi:outer membrane protein assembly factor BamB
MPSMRRLMHSSLSALALSLALGLLFSCSRPAAKPAAPASGDSASGAGAPAAAAAAATSAVPPKRVLALSVSYVSGQAELFEADKTGGAQPRALEPGDSVAIGATIHTGRDGICDLSVGDLGSLRVLPDTSLVIRGAEILGGSGLFRAELASGKVLAKARRLSGRESFMVSSPNAICGVRGTAFALSFGGKRSLIAVAEGHVAVLPSGPVFSRVEAASAKSELARGLIRTAVSLAPLVGEGQELSLGPKEAERSEASWSRLSASLEPLSGAAELPPEPLIPAEAVGSGSGGANASGDAAAIEALGAGFPKATSAGSEAKKLLGLLASFSGKTEVSGSAKPSYRSGLLSTQSAFSSRPVSSLLRSGDLVVAGDGAGNLSALRPSGETAWRFKGSGGTAPVLSKGMLYLASATDLLVLDASSGAIVAKKSLPSATPAQGGLAAFPDGVVAAGSSGVTLFSADKKSGDLRLPVKDGALAALHYEGGVLVVSGSGELLLLDSGSGATRAEAPALSSSYLRVYADRAALVGSIHEGAAGAKGALRLYSLPGLSLIARADLPFVPASEPEINKEGIFVWGEGLIAAFSPEGKAIGTIKGTSAPPLLSRGVLYYGTEGGYLVAARPADLSVISRLLLPARLSARPLAFDDQLRLPLADGSVVVADPAKFEAAGR